MKPKQHSFVVEYKGKRRAPVPPKPIWGNLDFRALAREVKADVPDLFETELSVTSPEIEPRLTRNDEPRASLNRATNEPLADDEHSRVIKESAYSDKFYRDIGSEFEDLGQLQQGNQSGPKKAKGPKRAARSRNPSLLLHEPTTDDLRSLTEENKYLAKLLSTRLIKENLWLRDMLTRYELEASDED